MKNLFVVLLAFSSIPFGAWAQTPAARTPKETAALETMGATSGLLVYQTYLVIGSVADGYGASGYTKETVVTLMDEQVASCNNIIGTFDKLLLSGFLTDPTDEKYVRDIITTMKLLVDEAKLLKIYVETPNDANLATYDATRIKAWNMITALLSIK